MTASEARQLALQWLQEHRPSRGDALVLQDALTMERGFGWVFFYQSKAFLETGDIRYAVTGNAPLVVTRVDGRIHVTGTARPIESYLEGFRDYAPE